MLGTKLKTRIQNMDPLIDSASVFKIPTVAVATVLQFVSNAVQLLQHDALQSKVNFEPDVRVDAIH
jgi:hypothetical protein